MRQLFSLRPMGLGVAVASLSYHFVGQEIGLFDAGLSRRDLHFLGKFLGVRRDLSLGAFAQYQVKASSDLRVAQQVRQLGNVRRNPPKPWSAFKRLEQRVKPPLRRGAVPKKHSPETRP
jgi:hypothetical protein